MQRKGKKRDALKEKIITKRKYGLQPRFLNNNTNNNTKFDTRIVSKEREKIDNYCDLKYEIKSRLNSASIQKCRGIVLIFCAQLNRR